MYENNRSLISSIKIQSGSEKSGRLNCLICSETVFLQYDDNLDLLGKRWAPDYVVRENSLLLDPEPFSVVSPKYLINIMIKSHTAWCIGIHHWWRCQVWGEPYFRGERKALIVYEVRWLWTHQANVLEHCPNLTGRTEKILYLKLSTAAWMNFSVVQPSCIRNVDRHTENSTRNRALQQTVISKFSYMVVLLRSLSQPKCCGTKRWLFATYIMGKIFDMQKYGMSLAIQIQKHFCKDWYYIYNSIQQTYTWW